MDYQVIDVADLNLDGCWLKSQTVISGLDDDSDNWHVKVTLRETVCKYKWYPDNDSAKEQVYKQVILTDTGFSV